jgi:hypothetical protein
MGLRMAHCPAYGMVAHPQNGTPEGGRGLEGAEAVHRDVCRSVPHLLRPLKSLGAVFYEDQTVLPRKPGDYAEAHVPTEEVRDQHHPRARS